MSKATLLEVAKMAGVSIGTASRAVNGKPRVSKQAGKRVFDAVRKLGYVQPTTRQRLVAILIPTLEIPVLGDYFCFVFSALRQEIHQRGYRAITVSLEDYPLLNDWPVSGVISFDYIEEASHLLPKNSSVPLVCCNDRPNHLENIYSVQTNFRKVLREAVDYLVGLGHIRIGLFHFQEARPLILPEYERILKEAMAVHGLEKELFFHPYSKDLSAYEAVSMLLRDRVTAIIAINGGMIVDHFLKLSGKRIPEDISLITEDTIAASDMSPRHTILKVHYEELARKAVDMLETIWEGSAVREDLLVDTELVVRESTGPAPRSQFKA